MKSNVLSFSLALIGLALISAGVFAAPVARTLPNMPSLEVQTLDGTSFDLAEQKGKWVIVNYWATWCGPCIKEMPALSTFVSEHDDVTAIGLAFEDTDRADLEAFLKKNPVTYPIAQIDIDNPPAAFDVPRGLPMTYVIAPDGSVAKQVMGPIDEKDLARITGKAVEQPAPAKP